MISIWDSCQNPNVSVYLNLRQESALPLASSKIECQIREIWHPRSVFVPVLFLTWRRAVRERALPGLVRRALARAHRGALPQGLGAGAGPGLGAAGAGHGAGGPGVPGVPVSVHWN